MWSAARVSAALLLLFASAPFQAYGSDTKPAAATGNVVDSSFTLDLDHAFGSSSPFTPRGKVSYVVSRTERKLVAKSLVATVKMTDADRNALISLAQQPHDDLYRIRIPSVDAEGNVRPDVPLIASVRACALLRGQGKELLHLHAEGKTGALLALTYESPVSGRAASACPEAEKYKSSPLEITTKLVIELQKEAPAVPLALWGADVRLLQSAQGKGGEGEGDDKEPVQEETFMKKYGYIMIPMMIWTLFIQPMLAPKPDGPPNRGGAGAPAPPAGGGGGKAKKSS